MYSSLPSSTGSLLQPPLPDPCIRDESSLSLSVLSLALFLLPLFLPLFQQQQAALPLFLGASTPQLKEIPPWVFLLPHPGKEALVLPGTKAATGDLCPHNLSTILILSNVQCL